MRRIALVLALGLVAVGWPPASRASEPVSVLLARAERARSSDPAAFRKLLDELHSNGDKGTLLQIGLVGYGQYQTTDHRDVTAIAAATHYRVNALGIAAGVMVPERQIEVGVKYLKEFANKATVQGHSLQITASMTF